MWSHAGIRDNEQSNVDVWSRWKIIGQTPATVRIKRECAVNIRMSQSESVEFQ